METLEIKKSVKNGKPEIRPAASQDIKKTEITQAPKILDQKLEKIQHFSSLCARLASYRTTLLKLQEFKYSSTRTNDYLSIKDGAEYNNEFKTSNIRYVEKVRDFLVAEIRKDIAATEIEIEAATL